MLINPFAISALLTAITCFLLSILVFIYGKIKLHKIWTLFNLSIGGWAFYVFLAAISTDPSQAYFFWRVAHVIGIYVSIFFFHSVCIFCNLHFPKFIRISYCYGVFHNIINFLNNGNYLYKYDSTKYLFDSIYYLQTNNLNFILALSLWIFLAIFGIYHLYQYSKKNKDQSGYQAKLWMALSVFGYFGGSSVFLPMLGLNIYPITLILLPIYALIITYAIFKYQFLNVCVVLEKSIVYSLLIASISIIYLTIVIILEKLLQSLLGYRSTLLSLSSAFIIGVLVIPLRNKIQFLLDRTLFRGTNPEIARENELLRQEVAQKEKFRAVATLASGIAHEVRNPLTALKTFFEYYPEKKNDPVFMEKFNEIAGREFGRIEGLVQHLLDFAKPSPPSLKETDINQLIEESLNLLSNKFRTNNIKISKHLASSIEHLRIDGNQIKQALLNIFLNAIEAMPGGGQLTVETTIHASSAQKINLGRDLAKIKNSGGRFTLHVTDTGEGIDKKELPHLFEPFYSKKDSGTGLGLAITYGIIQEHRGKIKVNSEVGKGTKFIIELPMHRT